MLISPANTQASFQLKLWSNQPQQVIIDSSSFYYLSNTNNLPPQKHVFKQQLRIIDKTQCPVTLCHLDNPINPKRSDITSTFLAIEKTLGNAYEFLELFHKCNLVNNPQIRPMGVIQGSDIVSIKFCANELKRLGFKKFGLGSLAPLYNPAVILKRIKAATEVIGGENLHIFGISRLDIIKELKHHKIISLDSTRPMKAAIYNAIFYSNPFRTYGVYLAKNAAKYSKILKEPLNCSCPSCQHDPYLMLKTGTKKSINARAIHNYYHLLHHLKK